MIFYHGGVNNGFFTFNGPNAFGQHHDGLPAPDLELHGDGGGQCVPDRLANALALLDLSMTIES